ncbi:MAG: hypothetical protein SFY32_05820 [Bacteroidota bacterium]|nr:hypothetical protein [Bacteroidota bacterium]
MNVKIIVTPDFEKDTKSLLKKYKSLKSELQELLHLLIANPTLGTFLGKDCYKIRLSVKSKGKGKSGGLRVITNVIVKIENNSPTKIVNLIAIYDKSDFDSIKDIDLMRIIDKYK